MQTIHFQTRPHTPLCAAINADVMAKLALAERAVESLTREGHTVVNVDLSESKPAIQILPSAHLAKLADSGQCAYYMRGVGKDGLVYRKWTLTAYRNVNVAWFERGH